MEKWNQDDDVCSSTWWTGSEFVSVIFIQNNILLQLNVHLVPLGPSE
jgi:hypothetical protein